MTPSSESMKRSVSSMPSKPSSDVDDGESEGERDGSRVLKFVKTMVTELGRYGSNIEYYLIQPCPPESICSNVKKAWPDHQGSAETIFHDPYGLISRWKVQRENGNR